MAIIFSVPRVEVEVRVNGERAEEYMDSNQNDSDNTAIRYIEAKSGARFTIHSHMVFSELDTDEDSTDISNRKMQKKVISMGVISIQLHRGLAIKEAPCNRTTTIDKIGKVPKKALKGKALSHQVQLQAFQPAKQSKSYRFVCDDPEKRPFAEFIYQYRSKTALQAEGVIPRTSSPIPLEDRPLEELNPEELRELLRRSRKKIAAATAVKNESESEVKNEVKLEDNASAKGSKRAHDRSELEFVEARPVKRQRASRSAPVIIDLSDD